MDNPATKPPAAAANATTLPADPRTFADFLETCGPDTKQYVSALLALSSNGTSVLQTPEIKLHCDGETCSGVRLFSCEETHFITGSTDYEFVQYICNNCGRTLKIFALAVTPDGKKAWGWVEKFSELPPFGPPIPARVMKLVGKTENYF